MILEKRGLFELGEFAGLDANWNQDPSQPDIEEGRLGDFLRYYSDTIFPNECVQKLTCQIGARFPQLRDTVDW